MTVLDSFRDVMAAAGLTPPDEIIADGRLHRFATNDRRDDDAGWYVLHDDGIPAGAFGDWRTGVNETWCAQSERTMTEAERAEHRKRIAALKRQREEEERRQHADAAARARDIWESAPLATAEHPYLKRKHVCAYNLRVHHDGRVIVPLRDPDGNLTSLEFIADNGDKQFLYGGRVKSCFYLIGEPGDFLCIAEGFATAASIHEATGYPVAVAFSAGNLRPLAQALRAKYPNARMVMAGDHDETGRGQAAAKEAAEAIGGAVAIPETPSDWNDVHVAHGLEAVKAGVEAARPPSHTSPRAETAHLHTLPPLAQEPNILARFAGAVRACGVVGEERNAKLIYLALTSRLLAEPVSLAMKGTSSSGKSFTTETTLRFFPRVAYISMTAMSERALVYMKEPFAHRTLVLFEAVALREQREKNESNLTAYFVRSLLSEGRISYPVTVRDKQEGFVTKTIVKEGPTNLILTTTATQLHGENETRLISLPTNDSADQTRSVLLKLAEGAPPAIDFGEWHRLQDWLAGAEHRVFIPYARYLAEQIPPVAVRLRRDFKSILRLIETHAILHQHSRDRDGDGRIMATEADYLVVRDLVADLIAEGVGATVPPSVQEAVEAVRDLDLAGEGVTVKAVADRLKLDRSATQRRIQAARERGYLVNLEDKRGRPARYIPGDALPDEVELLPRAVSEGGVQLCSDRRGGNKEEADAWLEL